MSNLTNISQKTLEFPEAKQIVSAFCSWSGGQQAVADLQPATTTEAIYLVQNRIRQLAEIHNEGESIPLSGFVDIKEKISPLTKGATPDIETLLEVRSNLRIADSVIKMLLKEIKYPYIFETLKNLPPLTELLKHIERIFEESGTIKNSASPHLRELRGAIMELEGTINSRLSHILRDISKQKMLQEQLYTYREGRYVLPIKQEYKGVFDGLVLDSSSSGSTLFMEPMEIVEYNNRLREVKADEKSEINRILRDLGAQIGRYESELIETQQIFAELDCIDALARYMQNVNGILPLINSTGSIVLNRARHPLLAEKAIPIDIKLGKDYKIVVITGPNTGGKTVALKTVGLLSLMALSGMPVPAGEGTEFTLLDAVYADIGDEQSIAQSLSTFSSHMNRIISIVKEADSKSLVLLDELGAGTDPREGSAIGISILEYFSEIRANVIVTTHYGELKFFASNHPMAMNAAMEFNPETFLPTYRILLGVPGRSCALSIAGSLGLSTKLIHRSRELLSNEYIEADKILENIEHKERALNDELTMHKQLKKEAQALKDRYEEELDFVKKEQIEIMADGIAEAESLLKNAKMEIDRITKGFIKKIYDKKNPPDPAELKELKESTNSRMDSMLERLSKFKKRKGIKSDTDRERKVGDLIFVNSLNKDGTILEINNDSILVGIGKLKMRVTDADIRASKQTNESEQSSNEKFATKSVEEPEARLMLIGMYADEAISELDRYIEELMREGKDSLTVVHGKGAGILRNAVQNYLRRNKNVISYRQGGSGEGSDGVTVVTLKG